MRSLLDQLRSEEAILLMYLADELPSGDRTAVEARLASDARLRAELQRLQKVHEAIARGLHELDAAQPLPGPAALRQMSRLIRQWQADHAAERTGPAAQSKRGVAWWVHATAAAAVLVVCGLLYVTYWGEDVQGDGPGVDGGDLAAWENLEDEMPVTPVKIESQEEMLALVNAEDELSALEYLRMQTQ